MSTDFAVQPSLSPLVPEQDSAESPVLAVPGKVSRVRPRNEAIDVIRLFAAIAIVYIHAVRSPVFESSRDLLRFAVPFYLFASFYFQSLSLRSNTNRTFWQYVSSRIKRLYFPFLAWSAIYLMARDVKRIAFLHLPPVSLGPGLLWKGIEYQLWFLPFLLAGSILLTTIHWTTLRRDVRWRWPLIVIALCAGLAFATLPMPSHWDETFDNPTYAYVQFWRSLPAACWAMAFAWLMTTGPVVHGVSMVMGLWGIALAAVCSVQQAIHGIQLVPRALSGLGCMLAALAPWKGPAVPILARLGKYSYGIYLCHVLIAEAVRAVASHSHLPESAGLDMLVFVSTLLGSILMVLALGGSARTAWLNG